MLVWFNLPLKGLEFSESAKLIQFVGLQYLEVDTNSNMAVRKTRSDMFRL